MINVCDELYDQLKTWHASIPEAGRPELDGVSAPNEYIDRRSILRIRYYAARHIIHRPFVLYLSTHRPADQISEELLRRADICLHSCRRYIHNVTPVLRGPSQYTWTFSLSWVSQKCVLIFGFLTIPSSLGAIVVLTLASLSTELKHMVPDIDELQSMTIQNIRPWGFRAWKLYYR